MDNIRIYSSESSIRRPGVLLKTMWNDVLQSRGLAWRLALRDISGMYRQSFLGILWAFIVPLANALVWILLRTTGIVSVGETDIPYPVYVFSGTMLWAVFTECLQAPLQKTLAAKSMLSKINFPQEAVILSGICQAGFNAGIKAALIVVGMIALGYLPGWTSLLFPFGVLSLMLAGTSIGLILTPLGMLYSDVGKGLTLVMQFLMYATPVVYPMPKEGWASVVISYNPITPLVMTTRDWLTGNATEFLNGFVWVNLTVLGVFFLGLIVYKAAMPFLIERMSS